MQLCKFKVGPSLVVCETLGAGWPCALVPQQKRVLAGKPGGQPILATPGCPGSGWSASLVLEIAFGRLVEP